MNGRMKIQFDSISIFSSVNISVVNLKAILFVIMNRRTEILICIVYILQHTLANGKPPTFLNGQLRQEGSGVFWFLLLKKEPPICSTAQGGPQVSYFGPGLPCNARYVPLTCLSFYCYLRELSLHRSGLGLGSVT